TRGSTTDHRPKQTRGITIVTERVWPRRRNDEMRLFELTLLFDQNRRCRSWLAGLESQRSYPGATFTTIKGRPNELDETCVLNVSGRGDDEMVVIELA